MLHSVGCPQPDPNVFIKIWNDKTNNFLTHIIIGADEVYEVLPCTKTKGKAVYCWHIGDANGYTIGAEMTEPSTIKYTNGSLWIDLDPVKTKAHVMATYRNAVDTFAELCIFHNLDPLVDGVILSHSECYKRGIGTNHGDVEHIWSKFGLSMSKFRADIKEKMGKFTKPYLVRISIDNLNMRTGPATAYRRIGYIPKGVYTIVEIKDGWGRIKSKQQYDGEDVNAWIHLGYTTKL